MRTLVLAGLLLILAANAFPKPQSFVLKRLQSMISEKDHELFNSDEGLWFLDDEGRLVRATLDMPHTLSTTFITMDEHVFFYLYTRGSEKEQIYINDVRSLRKSNFDPTRETKFVTHGWINSKNSAACTLIKDAYLRQGDYNVIVVDWSRISLRPYGWAAAHVTSVGKYVASMVDFLISEGINVNTTTLVGHSLGAHVVGLAGYYSESTVNYVVGLDPALPLFAMAGEGSRISMEDAKHVEIIHTNAGLLGYLSPIGKADFYPNGGKKQLGCTIDIGGACSHVRSYEYYAESITTNAGFYGQNCESYDSFKKGTCQGSVGLMGGPKPYLPYNGTYYLTTMGKSPFAKGQA